MGARGKFRKRGVAKRDWPLGSDWCNLGGGCPSEEGGD